MINLLVVTVYLQSSNIRGTQTVNKVFVDLTFERCLFHCNYVCHTVLGNVVSHWNNINYYNLNIGNISAVLSIHKS